MPQEWTGNGCQLTNDGWTLRIHPVLPLYEKTTLFTPFAIGSNSALVSATFLLAYDRQQRENQPGCD
jgi:hypothetical protein